MAPGYITSPRHQVGPILDLPARSLSAQQGSNPGRNVSGQLGFAGLWSSAVVDSEPLVRHDRVVLMRVETARFLCLSTWDSSCKMKVMFFKFEQIIPIRRCFFLMNGVQHIWPNSHRFTNFCFCLSVFAVKNSCYIFIFSYTHANCLVSSCFQTQHAVVTSAELVMWPHTSPLPTFKYENMFPYVLQCTSVWIRLKNHLTRMLKPYSHIWVFFFAGLAVSETNFYCHI